MKKVLTKVVKNNWDIKTSYREAGDAVNIHIQYFKKQPGTDDIHLLQLRQIKECIKVRSYNKKLVIYFT